MLKQLSRALVAFVIVSVLVGCATNRLPPASVKNINQNIENYQYIIGPDDVLNVFVWRNPELGGNFAVRPDGKISTSLIEDIKVAGLTPSEASRLFEAELSTYLKDPIVTISVSNFRGPTYQQIRVVGSAIERPLAINYRQDITLLDVMIQVGGLSEFADGDDALIMRIVDGQYREYPVNIEALLESGDLNENVDMLPGDIIVIPEVWF